MRISDCSSDVCSSDLESAQRAGLRFVGIKRLWVRDNLQDAVAQAVVRYVGFGHRLAQLALTVGKQADARLRGPSVSGRPAIEEEAQAPGGHSWKRLGAEQKRRLLEIGRTTCRERVGRYGEFSGVPL